ncbi:MAG: nickel pincer cofactor biosynthesis protein LarB [Thermomicrobiales bacterium]
MTETVTNLQATLAAFATTAPVSPVGDYARLDPERLARAGTPEVIYAAGKTAEPVVAIAQRLVAERGRAIASRLTSEQYAALRDFAGQAGDIVIERRDGCPTALLWRRDASISPTGGQVGILTAGTSDLPAADEARVMAEEMGCQVSLVCDVGVAGIHRLFEPLRALLADGAGALIVAAGRDGALPSVVAGLSPVPVIGLPTSIGYGAGGGGVAALLSMLQSCAPGLAVVNIDNGIGAGAMAALIANGAARGKGRDET